MEACPVMEWGPVKGLPFAQRLLEIGTSPWDTDRRALEGELQDGIEIFNILILHKHK